MGITVKRYTKEIHALFEKAKNTALMGMGLHVQDSLADGTNKLTGLLANSYNFRIIGFKSPFGNRPMKEPKQVLTESERVTVPPKDTVRTGSGLSYAEPYNKKKKVFERTIDNEQRNLGLIGQKAFNKVMG